VNINPRSDREAVAAALHAHNVNEKHIPGIVNNLTDSVQARIAEHRSSPAAKEKREKFVALLEYILETTDHDKFAQLQNTYLDLEDEHFIAGFSKYIDPIGWCESKLETALRFGLDKSEPKRILDIGTGPGHFQIVARHLGHDVVGTELPSLMKATNKIGRYYQDLEAVYDLKRIPVKIDRDGWIHKFDEKFDLVTAFLAAFSVGSAKEPWPLQTWITFFDHIRTDVLKPGGATLMTLTRGKVTADVWHYLRQFSDYYNDRSMEIHFTDFSWVDYDPTNVPTSALTNARHVRAKVKSPEKRPSTKRRVKKQVLKLLGRSATSAYATPHLSRRPTKPVVRMKGEKPLITEWRSALLTRDFARFEALSDGLSGTKVSKHHYSAARYFTEIGRFDRAAPLWERLVKEPSIGFEATVTLARVRAQMGVPVSISAMMEEFGWPGSYEVPGMRSFKAPVAEDVIEPGTRHIAIAGVSYCGSTLTDRIFAGLEGVASIGESHWLTTAVEDRQYKEVDFDTVMLNRGTPCSVCGDACPVLTRDFRTDLIGDKTRWYYKIANQLGTKTLVSADKNYSRFLQLDPLMRFAALVLYKPPVDAWYSQYKKMEQGLDEAVYLERLETYLETWYRSYALFLDHFEPLEGKIFVDFRQLSERPAEIMPKICQALGLSFDPIILERTRPGHAIGGNSGAMRGLREDDYKVNIRPMGQPELPHSHLRHIRNHDKTRDIFAALEERTIR